MKTYHIGILRGKESRATIQFQARACIDDLDCELLKYVGEHITTKKGLHNRLKADYANILNKVNQDIPGTKRILLTID